MKDFIKSKNFGIVLSHKGPDGDSLGSSIALSSYLKKIGLDNQIIVPDIFPGFYNWLNGIGDVIVADQNLELLKTMMDKADVLFCLDFNHISRVGPNIQPFLENTSKGVVVVDHHTYPQNFGDLEYIDSEASSTCELVYQLIESNNDIHLIDKLIGQAIYTGLMTDTGSFKYSSVTPLTHKIASHLIKLGVNHSFIHEKIHDQNSFSRIKLLGYALQKISVEEDLSLAYLVLTENELDQFNYQKGDTEGFVNYCLSINNIAVAVFIKEDKDVIKISFRSKGEVKVNEFSKMYYNGGGHQNAAGAAVEKQNINDFVEQLLINFKSFCLNQ